MPQLSVVMAVHNAADYLPQALASLRWQTLTDWECVAVNDGSTDGSAEVLERFARADRRFRVLHQEKAGITAALTLGDAAAECDTIARMDSDDVALPTRLGRQFGHMRAHPECVGVGAQVMLVDPTGDPIGVAPHATEHDKIERRLLAADGGTIAHPTLMFRRDVADRVGGHRAEYEWAHDADLLVRLAEVGRLANLPDVLLLYRQHPRNTCRTRHAEIRQQMLGLLDEAHRARGGELPAPVRAKLSGESRPTPLAGKWARRAARNGYGGAAWRLWREMARTAPFSLTTARVGLEAAARLAAAKLTGNGGEPLNLPDWRQWDAPVSGAKLAEERAA